MSFRIKQQDQSGYVGPEDCWKELGAAVVRQTATDWVRAFIALKNPDTAKKEMSTQLKSAERFLLSEDCMILSDIDGCALLQKMKRMNL